MRTWRPRPDPISAQARVGGCDAHADRALHRVDDLARDRYAMAHDRISRDYGTCRLGRSPRALVRRRQTEAAVCTGSVRIETRSAVPSRSAIIALTCPSTSVSPWRGWRLIRPSSRFCLQVRVRAVRGGRLRSGDGVSTSNSPRSVLRCVRTSSSRTRETVERPFGVAYHGTPVQASPDARRATL